MPPRYAYWTILVDDQPTAFRASAQEDLMPTLKRLQAKNASAKMMWWQNGKLWNSRHEAQDAMHMRGEMGRRGDERQGGGFRDRQRKPFGDRDRKPFGDRERKPFRDRNEGAKRTAWTSRGEPSTPAPERDENNKLAWKPKGEFVPAPKRADRKPEWKPKSSFDRERKPFKSSKPEWKTRGKNVGANFSSPDRERKPRRDGEKLEWKPKGSASSDTPKRKWVPKEEYKKSQGVEARRDKNWRPGGEHKDPRQKYKDAKKAKWTRFKKAIRTKWESKGKKKSDE